MAPRRPPKNRRLREATAADALMSLPPNILDEILTRLNLRDAVRTSALSRAWRRRWESLPSVDIVIYEETPQWTVDCVLLRCSGRVRRFYVDLDELSVRRLHDWLLILSRRGVEDLQLSQHNNELFSLPSTVFSCHRLVSLDLFICDVPPLPPTFEGFPNLKHLTICSNTDYGWNFAELPCLRSAVIDLWEYIGDRDFAKFLAGLVQVKKLRLYTCYKPVNGIRMVESLPCTFNNLTSLKLFMHFCELPPIVFMFCILRRAPNLEKLKILIVDGEKQKIEANGEFLNAQWTDGMCANLQVVQMTGINWLPNELSFMKLILSKASCLRSLSVSHDESCSVPLETPLVELLKYSRASAQAQVLFNEEKGEQYGNI
ncbi:hypothetical protein ACP70R_006318 [Stipagrostis hirtigluma subsp. patula]